MPGINDRIGNYRLIEELPSGAYGLVFRGEHTFLINRVVAIKLLHRVHLNSQKERDSFIQEAKLLEVLEHPHILPIIDAEFHEGVPYIVTKYAQNGTLRNRLQRQSQAPLPVEEAVTILSQIGEALQYAHQKNIIHRDLKPENILFSDKNDVLLADFGISVVLVSGKTKQVGIGGTLPYMAPEQFEGMISRKSDQYALGCIAYELLTGHQPYMIPNPTIESMWYHHAKVIPYSPSQFNPNLPVHIEKALLKAMAKDRDERYASIADFMNALYVMPTSPARMFTIPQEVRLTERTSELLKFDVKATEVEQVRTKPLNNIHVTDSEQTPVRLSSHVDNKYVPHEPGGTAMSLAADIGLGGVAGIRNAGSSFKNGNADSHALSPLNIGSQAVQNISPNGSPILAGQPSKTKDLNDIQSKADPGPGTIPFPATLPRSINEPPGEARAVPIITSASKAKPNGSSAVPPTKGGNTGNRAVHDVEVAAAIADRSASNVGLPPSGGNPDSPGGGGGPNKRTRLLVAILLIVITLMLIIGISVIAVPGLLNSQAGIVHGISTTSTGTITPDSKVESNIYQIVGVTSAPDPDMREVSARIINVTSPAQSKTAQSTGSIPGTRATGSLTFLNTTTSAQTFGSVILTSSSGVQVTFNGPITVPASPGFLTVTGFAVNVGSAGNIGALDISGSCCATGITVKNGAFSGGQNPQPNSVMQQSDINGAANALTASLTPGTQASLQKQVHPSEQVVPTTLRCTSAVSADHAAGDHAPNVTVIVSVTCKEEVYDQQAALTLGANLLAKQASTDLGPNYALTGNIVAEVTRLTVVDTKGTLVIPVSAEGVWVYQFSNLVKKDFANHIAKATNQDAINYLMSQSGVKAVKIDNPKGNTLPDAAHITIEIVAIPGATGSPTPGTGTVMPVGPTVVPTGAVTPPAKPTPTPTQGLGGS